MSSSKETINNQKYFEFEGLINALKTKVTQEIIRQETKKSSQELKIKVINFFHKLLENFNIISLILTLGLVFGLFGTSVFLFLKSYDVFHMLSLAVNSRELSSVLLFISGIVSSGLGIASICKFESIFDGIYSFFETTIIRPLDKIFTRSKNKSTQRIKETGIDISYLNETLKSLTEMQENFKYLIHSKLKNKLFTSKDINLLYKHLTSSNISALIHLLYHDKRKDIRKMTVEEKEQLAYELDKKITTVKEYAEQLSVAQVSQSDDNVRHRRMDRLHKYPHDDLLAEVFSDLETNKQRKGRK